jgi:hypothetical protein
MTTEPDIPLVFGTPIDTPKNTKTTDFRTATTGTITSNGGSSSQLSMPTSGQEERPLSHDSVEALLQQGYTLGLANALSRNKLALPLRIWVVDNSGSMMMRDGHRLVPLRSTSRMLKQVECTRWKEMQETVEYHAQMAAITQTPTVFRMLNDPGRLQGPQQFSVAERVESIDHDLAVATSTIANTNPAGVTPLVKHLKEIRQNIVDLTPSLRQTGSKVAVVIATDGLPTDESGYTNSIVKSEFTQALRALQGLPVWVVVRLCTDDDDVVEFWNNIDNELELSMDVLDDFAAEAAEIFEVNPWLCYGLPLHRMREMGFHERVFDIIDERKLSLDEVYAFLNVLFGPEMMSSVPDPEIEWKGFLDRITDLVANEQRQWNPLTNRMEPWINIKRLNRMYGRPGPFSCFFR